MRAIALALLAAALAPLSTAAPCADAVGVATACLEQSESQSGPYTVTEAGASATTPLAEGATVRAYAGCATDNQGTGCDYSAEGIGLALAAIGLDATVEHRDSPFGSSVCFGPQPGEGTCLGLPLP